MNDGRQNSPTATVSITVVGKPTANGQSATTFVATAKAVTLTGSDPNTPPLSLTYTVTANPAHGTLSGTAPNLTYTPTAGYSGPDSFQFKVNNGTLDSGVATVTVTVSKATVNNTATAFWGTAANVALNTSGVQFLPAGRTTTLPWLGINKLVLTLDAAETIGPADVSVTGHYRGQLRDGLCRRVGDDQHHDHAADADQCGRSSHSGDQQRFHCRVQPPAGTWCPPTSMTTRS